jgi:hypothetical protein
MCYPALRRFSTFLVAVEVSPLMVGMGRNLISPKITEGVLTRLEPNVSPAPIEF